MYFIVFNLILFNIQSIYTEGHIRSKSDLGLTFGHTWDKGNDIVTIYFDLSNSTFNEYRYYYYEFRRFTSQDQTEYFPRQRLVDTHNSLHIFGLHEDDYVACISFIDEYENVFKPRFTCYEFTLGEKISGSHHRGSSGYLAPLLLAFAFVIHVFIAIVHHIKSKKYGQKILERFIDVDHKLTKKIIDVKHSLKELDHPYVSTSVQRRLSRVSIDANENDGNSFLMKKSSDNLSHHHRKISLAAMKTIAEYNP
ncbi:unnamed protein product [Adineta steineri]|uniref:Uncharacterized protein n=1 Tax=Adineta steineri TaxID=433720 RepID=A0A814EE79_9BILA|nr:unnamed protein product [Adineta steineri]CAF0967743.1 unnamed protein product [Adineta steineri]CAF1091331.1 unnamed protein product [Adineta steineri]